MGPVGMATAAWDMLVSPTLLPCAPEVDQRFHGERGHVHLPALRAHSCPRCLPPPLLCLSSATGQGERGRLPLPSLATTDTDGTVGRGTSPKLDKGLFPRGPHPRSRGQACRHASLCHYPATWQGRTRTRAVRLLSASPAPGIPLSSTHGASAKLKKSLMLAYHDTIVVETDSCAGEPFVIPDRCTLKQ
ncbi:hypothetical protein GQ53DRAFT_194239 [Thozetella sp. PMI_491]|nr:hypothetical protein GQ53DRAFT_194239 [Thozetella sp. PMI_491]